MTDYQSARVAAVYATGRELKVGERYCSVLLEEGGSLVRKDFALDAWHGPARRGLRLLAVPRPRRDRAAAAPRR